MKNGRGSSICWRQRSSPLSLLDGCRVPLISQSAIRIRTSTFSRRSTADQCQRSGRDASPPRIKTKEMQESFLITRNDALPVGQPHRAAPTIRFPKCALSTWPCAFIRRQVRTDSAIRFIPHVLLPLVTGQVTIGNTASVVLPRIKVDI